MVKYMLTIFLFRHINFLQNKYLEKKMLDFLENKGYTISAENI